jgi:SpoVK/Ycf46/Vps4 family AAA+-type ATPase
MSNQKFIDVIDSFQKQKDSQYVDYLSFIKMCDFHYQQQQYSVSSFCDQNLIQTTSYYGPSIIDPIKMPKNINNKIPDQSMNIPFPNIEKIRVNTPVEKTKKMTIDVDVNSLDDLIKIINNYTYDNETEYNIDLNALINIKEELIKMNSMIGLNDFKAQILNQLLYFIQNLHVDSESDFMHTVLTGSPGTGKTEIATILGQMYSKLGVLKKNTFKVVNRSDLVAGYLGQTAIKTSKVIEESLGGCLFIDEAYSLANNYEGDSFSRECIDTLCESLSKHKGELMVIIAGYKDEIEKVFFKANKGLESRFIWRFNLEKYNYRELISIFKKKITENNWSVDIDDKELDDWFKKYSKQFKHFGRDIEQLFSYTKMSHSRRIFGKSKEFRKQITLDDLNSGYDKFNQHNLSEEKPQLIGLYV